MQNSTLIVLLQSLTRDESKKLEEVVCSPYFNKKSAVIKLWVALKGYAPKYTSEKLTHERIYAVVFPRKAFNYGTLKNLIYDLTRLVEKVLELEISEQKKMQRNINLLEMLLAKGMESHFQKTFKSASILVEQQTDDIQYYNYRHALEVLRQNFLIITDRHYEIINSIQNANTYLTLSYFIDVFVNNYNAAILKTELNNPDESKFMKKVIEYYKNSPVKIDYKTKIYFNAFMLIYEGSKAYFYRLKELLGENNNKLSNEQKYNFYVALANYSGSQADKLAEFAQEEYDIYRLMIENSIYSINNVTTIDGNFYRKAASAAGNAGEFKWALNFINKYKSKLEENARENHYNHAMIEYYIKQKNFKSALMLLLKITHTNPVDKLNIKSWQMMCYYELGYFEELRNLVDSTRHFIASDKNILELKKKKLQNFISFISKMVYIKDNSSKKQGENIILKSELADANVSHKRWFREKIEEL
jgi:hypothetical protein